ncbi:ABC transporter permease [Actinokineospora sp. NPDC004072]
MADPGIYWRLVLAQVRSQTQYRMSFAIDLVASTLVSSLDIATVFILFSVTGGLGGFGGPAVLLIAGLAALAFALADAVFGNAERLRALVRTGEFDAILLRPLSALAQILAGNFAPRRLGRVVQGLVVYGLGLGVAEIDWGPGRVLLAVVAPVAGAVLFGSLFVIGATVAFWWVESGEVANAFTYGGRDFTSYPLTMYGSGAFGRFFAFGAGFAFVAYLPALALLDVPDPMGVPDWLRWCSPLTAAVAATAAAAVWRVGVRHYRSTGS